MLSARSICSDLVVNFANEQSCTMAREALIVDEELQPTKVLRILTCDGAKLNV
jgi:Transcription factor Pcc1